MHIHEETFRSSRFFALPDLKHQYTQRTLRRQLNIEQSTMNLRETWESKYQQWAVADANRMLKKVG